MVKSIYNSDYLFTGIYSVAVHSHSEIKWSYWGCNNIQWSLKLLFQYHQHTKHYQKDKIRCSSGAFSTCFSGDYSSFQLVIQYSTMQVPKFGAVLVLLLTNLFYCIYRLLSHCLHALKFHIMASVIAYIHHAISMSTISFAMYSCWEFVFLKFWNK